jgi:hypothetical protein
MEVRSLSESSMGMLRLRAMGAFRTMVRKSAELLAVAVCLARASQGNLIVRKRAAFWGRRSLGVRSRLRSRWWRGSLTDISRGTVSDWSDHDWFS